MMNESPGCSWNSRGFFTPSAKQLFLKKIGFYSDGSWNAICSALP
jgi:hypothetical protein